VVGGVVQPIHVVLADLRASTDRLNKFATRQWSVAAKQLKQVLDKVMTMAEDEGRMTREAVQHYNTSCTSVIIPIHRPTTYHYH